MTHYRKMFAATAVLLFVLSLSPAACSMPVPSSAPMPEGTLPAVTATPMPAEPGTPAEHGAATATVSPTEAAAPPAEPEEVIIYLVALEDNGASGPAVGCGDSLIAVTRPASAGEPVQAALTQLFAIKEEVLGESGLYNALWQSNLSVESVSVDNTGTATVVLAGSILLSGTCDSPRFKAQIEQTVLSVQGVQAVNVLINGEPIDEVLSQQ